ncbi:MAG: hypothetical protein KatS3mg058_4448 [Roseiflexus sp.]|nr:MAG: hypothetical protein KatS3mg058_4448 [Roseiflexus sp.]
MSSARASARSVPAIWRLAAIAALCAQLSQGFSPQRSGNLAPRGNCRVMCAAQPGLQPAAFRQFGASRQLPRYVRSSARASARSVPAIWRLAAIAALCAQLSQGFSPQRSGNAERFPGAPLGCGLKSSLRTGKPRRGWHELSQGFSPQRSGNAERFPGAPLGCGLKSSLRTGKPRRGWHELSQGFSPQRSGNAERFPGAPLGCGLKSSLRTGKPRRGWHELSQGFSPQRSGNAERFPCSSSIARRAGI